MSRRRIIAVTTVVLVLIGSAFGTYELANARTIMVTGDIVARVNTADRVVALTFDDGPSLAVGDEIRRALRAEQVTATFFLIGEQITAHPAEAKALAADGHQLANHSFTHQRMWFHSQRWYADEVDRTNAALRGIGYRGPLRFRPPYGKKLVGLPMVLAHRDMTTVMWDVDPLDVGASTPQSITDYVSRAVRPGSIVLLHPWFSAQVRASITPTIRKLKADGYRFVRVDELLTRD